MRIAIVGAGVAGLAAAYRLDADHEIEVFEAEPRAGGHAHTIDVDGLSLDSGFVVCNERNYPGFLGMARELGVGLRPSTMSFSVRCRRCRLEYSGHGFDGIFAQRRRLVSPAHLRLLADLGRFFRSARSIADDPAADRYTIGEYLARSRYGRGVLDHFLAPMGAAIWSSTSSRMEDMPARFFVRFFDNHGLLGVRSAPQWYTVEGGSVRYVDAICARLRGSVHLGSPVRSLRRDDGGVTLVAGDGPERRFDRVIIACHPDQALAFLQDPSAVEARSLAAIPFSRNETVMHRGDALLPRIHSARAAWNVSLDDCRHADQPVAITYSLNRLHALNVGQDYCVSLNQTVADSAVIARMTYEHPIFTLASVAAREELRGELGARRTDYAGAYLRWGFHEDGFAAGAEAAARVMA